MNEISKAAKLLSSLQIGKPKNFSEEEIMKRTLRLAEARRKRWGQNDNQNLKTKVEQKAGNTN